MNIVGETTDGRRVVGGVFFLQTSVGLPLDIIVESLKDQQCVPAWDVYVVDALNGGWFGDTIYTNLIQQGLDDNYVKVLMTNILQSYEYDDETTD